MAKRDFAFAGAVVLIIIGFILMSGGGSGDDTFNPAIFDARRIVVAPIVTVIGFIAVVYGILKKSNDKTTEE